MRVLKEGPQGQGGRSTGSHLFVELGVENRSMAGAVLMLPPVVETGDAAVVAKEAGFLDSSFSLCSWTEVKDSHTFYFATQEI